MKTEGIRKRKAIYTGIREMMEDTESKHTYYHTEGKDWHKTFKGAKIKAEEMRRRKIISLKKQLLRVEKITF